MWKLCNEESAECIGNLVPCISLQACGSGECFPIKCVANVSASLDGTDITVEKFLDCPSIELQDLKASISLDMVGQHCPELHRVLYNFEQKKIAKGDILPLNGMCFDTVDDCIDIPFLNEDDSVPAITIAGLTENTDYTIEQEVISDSLKGDYTKYCVKPIAGGAIVFGEDYVSSMEYQGYADMDCSKITTGRRVSRRFRFKLDLYEKVTGGVPKKNSYIFEDMTLSSELSLPVIDLDDGLTRSTLTFNASDKSDIYLYNQSRK